MRHRLAALPLALLSLIASLALASVALAGGWAFVAAQNAPVDPPAGEETTIELLMLQHGVTPVSWPGLTVIATEASSGAEVRVEAVAKGEKGAYEATFVFPTAGQWTLSFASNDLVMEGSVPLTVAPAAAVVGQGAASSATAAFDVMPLLLVLIAGVVTLVILGQVLHGRGAIANPKVSAGA